MNKFFLLSVIGMAPWCAAQTVKLPPTLEALGRNASEVVDVTMDATMLQFAARMTDKPGDAEAKRILGNLKALYVKSFEFEKDTDYTPADLEAVRSQLRAPGWSRLVESRSQRDKESADVYVKTENGEITGLVVFAVEPRELTLVSIDGKISPEDLNQIRGHAGVPRMNLSIPGRTTK